MSILRAAAAAVRRRVTLRFGTHNLHDEAGRPVMFADVVIFTEAVAQRVRAALGGRTRRVLVCEQQPSLIVVLNRLLFVVEGTEYRRAHGGLEAVTPARGTFVVKARIRFTRIRVAIVAEHRINAAFEDRRGELAFRAQCWHTHRDLTLGWIRELEAAGYVVFAGGDLNTPSDVLGYEHELLEVSRSYDRLGASDRVDVDDRRVVVNLHDFRRGPRRGSDHDEISVAATVTAPHRKKAAA